MREGGGVSEHHMHIQYQLFTNIYYGEQLMNSHQYMIILRPLQHYSRSALCVDDVKQAYRADEQYARDTDLLGHNVVST